MIFEYLLLLLLAGVSIFFIGIPLFKLIKTITPKKHNPLLEAKEKLEHAKLEAEAARLNKETEKVYNSLYEDVLQNDENKDRRKYNE